MKRLLAALIIGTCMSGMAYADNPSGGYVGAGVGKFNVKVKDVNSGTFKGDDTTLKVFAGWRLSPNFALEVDYIDLGKTSDTIGGIDFKSQVNGFAPFVIGTAPLGFIELFGKAGYYIYDVKFSDGTNSVKNSEKDFVYGGGVGVTVLGRLHVRLEYEKFDVKDTSTSDAVWLSGALRF